MDAVFGSPIPVLLVGLVVGSALGVGYLNTRRRGLLIGMGIVLVLVVGALAFERSVKTDRERIAETLDQLAAALQADGLPENSPEAVTDAVLMLITKARTKSAERTRNMVAPNLKRAKITDASYSNLRVEIDKASIPPTAEVRFDAKVSGEGRPPWNDVVAYRTYPLEFAIKMVYEKDDRSDQPRWLIGDRIGWRLKTFGGHDAEPERFGFDQGEIEGF
ncbi:MAG: hypothetical protein GXX96_06690 [Planctomycetaceae bacterium]|nr:hypothetical protein [Planctomycetaceae bacterium]